MRIANRKIFGRLFLLFGLSLIFLVPGDPAQDKPAGDKMRVLFVGNSLTYSNNLPEMVAQLAKSAKQRKLVYKTIAYPNFSLEDHWNKGEVQKILAREKWDFVVLQQGPSASAEGRQVLVDYAKKFAGAVAAAGARPALYMVWPAAARFSDFAGVKAGYRAAADAVDGLFLPAGEAWLEVWKLDPKFELYSPDRFHPNAAGSYLAALVIFQQLYKRSPVGLSARFRLSFETELDLPEKHARLLQQAADATNRKSNDFRF